VERFVAPERPQMATRRIRIACYIPKATNTHSDYVILIAFPLQQSLHKRAPVLRYTYIVCLVNNWFLSPLHCDDLWNFFL